MCVFSLTFQGVNQLLFQNSQLLYVLAKCNERSPLVLVIINREYSWLVGWFVGSCQPIFEKFPFKYMVRSTVTEREAQEGILDVLLAKWYERSPLVLIINRDIITNNKYLMHNDPTCSWLAMVGWLVRANQFLRNFHSRAIRCEAPSPSAKRQRGYSTSCWRSGTSSPLLL